MLDCRSSMPGQWGWTGRWSETVAVGQSWELVFLESRLPHVLPQGLPQSDLEACSWASRDVPQDRPELPAERQQGEGGRELLLPVLGLKAPGRIRKEPQSFLYRSLARADLTVPSMELAWVLQCPVGIAQ